MNISVILGHPYHKSFNHAIANTAVDELESSGHTVSFHDLYREKFDPIVPPADIVMEEPSDPLVMRHCDEIARADGIIIIHPNWWGQPPAILKGWVDRVLHNGLAYRFVEGDSGSGPPIGLLKAKRAIIFNTSNTGEQREIEKFGDPLERIWKDCIFGFCGVDNVSRKTYSIVCDSTPELRASWLEDARRMVGACFPR